MKIFRRSLCLIILLLSCTQLAWPFDLDPKGTRFDRAAVKKWSSFLDNLLTKVATLGLEKYKESVHEEITHRIYGCNHETATICGDPDGEFATPYIVAGVRWNDDPPFQVNELQITKMRAKRQSGLAGLIKSNGCTVFDCFLRREKKSRPTFWLRHETNRQSPSIRVSGSTT